MKFEFPSLSNNPKEQEVLNKQEEKDRLELEALRRNDNENDSDVFNDFISEETKVFKETKGFLSKLIPENFKTETAGLLAAFSVFASASSTYAGDVIEDMNAKTKITENKKENLKPDKFIEELEISMGSGVVEKRDKFEAEEVKINDKDFLDKHYKYEGFGRYSYLDYLFDDSSNVYHSLAASDFYKQTMQKNSLDYSVEYGRVAFSFITAINSANNAGEFFHYSENKNFNNNQKILFLQSLGGVLAKTYNEDMLKENEHVKVSDDAMFSAIKSYFFSDKTKLPGICANIHNFVVEAAKSMGVEAWMQTGSFYNDVNRKDSGHVFVGMVAETEGKKQIDYGTLITTGTLNYKDALGIAERYHRAIEPFSGFTGKDENISKVTSRAQDEINKAAGIENVSDITEKGLSNSEIKKEKSSLKIELNPEVKEIKLTENHFSLDLRKYEDVYSNPYQSLKNMDSLKLNLNLAGEKFGIDMGATVLNMNIKDLHNGIIAKNEIIGSVLAKYVDGREMTKGEYGKLMLNWGATMQTAMTMLSSNSDRFMGDESIGTRIIYVTPDDLSKFYIGVSENFRGQLSDFQEQKVDIKNIGKKITIGSNIKVQEAMIMNLEASLNEVDWGKEFDIKGGLIGKKSSGNIEYKESDSKQERFIPSGKEIGISAGYNINPKYTISISGFEKEEQYKDGNRQRSYGGNVKLNINLF